MMHDPSFADVLFILLVCGLIWGIMALIGRARSRAAGRRQEGGPGDDDRAGSG